MKTHDIAELKRIRVTNQARLETLTERSNRLRDAIREEDRITEVPDDAKPHVRASIIERARARQAKAAQLRKDLEGLEKDISITGRVIVDASRNITDIERSEDRERRQGVSDAVQTAAKAASGREEYIQEHGKLANFQQQLAAAETELDREFIEPQTSVEKAEDSARKLIDTGFMDTTQSSPDGSARIRDLKARIRTLTEAVRIQRRISDTAQQRYAGELVGNLKPIMAGIVEKIAESHTAAREAVTAARLLRVAIAVETGGEDSLMPSIEFGHMPAGLGIADNFTMYLDRQRLTGLL